MKKRSIIRTTLSLLLAAVLCLGAAASGGLRAHAEADAASALPVKALHPKQVEENPFMAKSDANIHHDGYNTDSTDEILPIGIYPEINVSYETTNANASPAIYFDSYGHAVVPLLGGIAIRDLNAEETKTLGYFSPKQHDGGGYVIQSSYTFLDAENRIVCPTSNNHVLILRATDAQGNVLPEFEKVLDIDIKAAAEAALGKALEQNLLSVVFDYEGNLWFATGGFRIYPERAQQGVIGYIAREAIDTILSGGEADLSEAVFVHDLTPGEGAENGIAASSDGAVILTNRNCYLLRANGGVEVVWCTPYESVGAKVSGEGDKTTGGGLAWGGGCSPTLTPDLVLFTDNLDPVNLLALDMKTGEVVASHPVLDDLPEGYQVAVLQYATELKALDLGHNWIFDIDWIEPLKDLRVLILSDNRITDISPLADKPLEYLEMFNNKVKDISCLAGKETLIDLNLCNTHVSDLSIVASMPNLQRVWMGDIDELTKDAVNAYLAEKGDTLDSYNFTTKYPTEGGWRTHPRYEIIKAMFFSGEYISFDTVLDDSQKIYLRKDHSY